MIRLYRAACACLEAHAEGLRNPQEPPREVDLAPSLVEATGQYQRDELNADAPHRDEDWSEDPEERRRPRIGFTRPRTLVEAQQIINRGGQIYP